MKYIYFPLLFIVITQFEILTYYWLYQLKKEISSIVRREKKEMCD